MITFALIIMNNCEPIQSMLNDKKILARTWPGLTRREHAAGNSCYG